MRIVIARGACGAALTALALLQGAACGRDNAQLNKEARLRIWRGESAVPSRKPWDEPLAPESLATDAAMLSRVLRMDGEELHRRLGPYTHQLATSFAFNQAQRRYAQDSLVRVQRDAAGSLHAIQDTKLNRAELYQIGPRLWVKHDNGPLREKPALNQPLELWRDLASRGLGEALELLQPYLRLQAPELVTHQQRTVLRYELALDDQRVAAVPPASPDEGSDDPAGWREHLRPTGLSGVLLVDRASAAPLRVELKCRADILDRPVQPTSMSLQLVSDIALTPQETISTPAKAVPEHKAVAIDRGNRIFLDGLTD